MVSWGIPNHDDVTNFLRAQVLCSAMNFSQKNNIFLFQGLASHIDRFVEEEVEVRHIPHLSNGDLRSLGFVTIGSRQRIRSAATAWVPQVICLCSSDSHVLKKVLYKYNDMFFFSREIWYQKSHTYVSSHRSLIHTPRRSRRGWRLNKLQMWMRKKERERSCESVWCLEIMCIFSPESIEKSLPHNLQEPNSRGEDNREEHESPDVNEEDGRWFKIIFHTKCTSGVLINRCSNVTWFISWTLIQNHFPHRCRRVGSIHHRITC